MTFSNLKVVALAGGVGGARLVSGLAQILPAENLTVIVNTGDDFEHLGLKICPDLDTVCYTLAGLANPETGWGRAGETWQAFDTMVDLGGPDWFHLGDRDLGLHLERTRRLQAGHSLSAITQQFCESIGIKVKILPMSDDPQPTWVKTEDGELAFQDYFVRLQCQPKVTGFRFGDNQSVEPAPGVLSALNEANLVVLCPSNPWVSIDPILAVSRVRDKITHLPVIAVSPIIGGRTVKGPAAKMFFDLGITPDAFSVANHYKGLLDGFILDLVDAKLIEQIKLSGIKVLATDTIMNTLPKRGVLATEILNFAISQLAKPL